MDRQRARKMKDPRLVGQLGLMEYWRTTKSQPDVCAREDVPFCRALEKVAAPKP